MCFSIPLKVKKVFSGYITVEGGGKVRTERNFRVKSGDYVQVAGNVAVGVLTARQGLQVRKLIRSLEKSYE